MATKIVPLIDTAAAATALANKRLTYQGGQLLTAVKVFCIYWGDAWSTTQAQLAKDLDGFFNAILSGPLIDQLGEYDAGQYFIGHGSFVGSVKVSSGTLGTSVQDSAIRQQFQSLIASGTAPAADANTLYFIYLPEGVTVVDGTAQSCSQFCGYHDATPQSEFYAVMPYPGCNGCIGQGMSVFDALTGTSSHELCEAITDPVPGTGWVDTGNNGEEIGDLCAWTFKKVAGYNVQLEWSNRSGSCV